MLLSLDDIIELKKNILKKYNKTLHMHDTCAGQYFSLDDKIEGIEVYIREFLKGKNITPVFSDDKLSFSINK